MAAKKAGRCLKRARSGRCIKRAKRRRSGYRKTRASAKRRTKSRGYKRGHRAFNKGKKCKSYAVNKRGIRTCSSYGGKGSKRNRSRIYGPVQENWLDAMARRSRETSDENFVERSVGGLSGYRRSRRRMRRR